MSNPTAAEIKTAMVEAVDDRIRKKFNATVSFSVDGAEPFVLKLKNDGDAGGKVDLEVKTSLQTLQDLLAKKMTPQQAFMKGKLKIKGKMGLAMKLTMLLDATRKRLINQPSRL